MIAPLAVTRRTFTLGSAVLGVGATIPLAAARAASVPPALLLFDSAIEDGRRFAALARSAEQMPRDTGRDLAQLLYGEWRDWARNPDAVMVGVTRYADFQVAAGIARENGRSVRAALVREQKVGSVRMIAGSPAGLLSVADCLSATGFTCSGIDQLVCEAGSVVWVCA